MSWLGQDRVFTWAMVTFLNLINWLVNHERVYVEGMRLITGASARSNIANLYQEADVRNMWNDAMLSLMFKVKHHTCPSYLSDTRSVPLWPPEQQQKHCHTIHSLYIARERERETERQRETERDRDRETIRPSRPLLPWMPCLCSPSWPSP